MKCFLTLYAKFDPLADAGWDIVGRNAEVGSHVKSLHLLQGESLSCHLLQLFTLLVIA